MDISNKLEIAKKFIETYNAYVYADKEEESGVYVQAVYYLNKNQKEAVVLLLLIQNKPVTYQLFNTYFDDTKRTFQRIITTFRSALEIVSPNTYIIYDKQRKGYAKEAAIAVRDWTFNNTSFNVVYSYMKHTNEPSYKTAISYGCKQVGEYKDDVNEITKVFAITREEWDNR